MSNTAINMAQLASDVRDVLKPIALSHVHHDKRYSFQINYNGNMDTLYIYAFDSVDENDVYED